MRSLIREITRNDANAPRAPVRVGIALSQDLRALHLYWLSKRGQRRMPARKDIDPAEIPSLLPRILLLDVHEGRLRFRLVGNAIAELYGFDLARKFLDDVMPPARYEVASRSYSLALNGARPLVSRSKFTTPNGAILMVTRLLLPLSDDDVSANMILAGVTFERGPVVLKEVLGPQTAIDPDVAIHFL